MKNIALVLLPVVLVFSVYLVFYRIIECKPGDPGFWFILALGMSIGVAFTKFSQWIKNRNKNQRT